MSGTHVQIAYTSVGVVFHQQVFVTGCPVNTRKGAYRWRALPYLQGKEPELVSGNSCMGFLIFRKAGVNTIINGKADRDGFISQRTAGGIAGNGLIVNRLRSLCYGH